MYTVNFLVRIFQLRTCYFVEINDYQLESLCFKLLILYPLHEHIDAYVIYIISNACFGISRTILVICFATACDGTCGVQNNAFLTLVPFRRLNNSIIALRSM